MAYLCTLFTIWCICVIYAEASTQNRGLLQRFARTTTALTTGVSIASKSGSQVSRAWLQPKYNHRERQILSGFADSLYREAVQVKNESYDHLIEKYGGKLTCIDSPLYPHCTIFLCGTLHVSNTSIAMVRDVIKQTNPHFVVLELCSEREDTLKLSTGNEGRDLDTLVKIAKHSWKNKSIRTFCVELFALMQWKGAQYAGTSVGGELAAAAEAAHRQGSVVVLGDRCYSVTMQRMEDRLSLWGKISMVLQLIVESLSISVRQVKEFLHSSDDMSFVLSETADLLRSQPAIGHVVITERDEYLARNILDTVTMGFGPLPQGNDVTYSQKGRVVAVVGAGHLAGITRHLLRTNGSAISDARMRELASSREQECTWPGLGKLLQVNTEKLFNLQQE